MNEQVRQALGTGKVIDVTTTGSRSGQPRRIEIVFHNFGGRLYISGIPSAERTRAWLSNLAADPNFTFHLKGEVQADLPATARVVVDEAERRAVFAEVAKVWAGQDIDTMTRWSPLVEVTIDDLAA